MPTSRADRRRDRAPRAIEVFGEGRAQLALDLLELTELAWHDCYGEITPSEGVIEDMFLLSGGDLGLLVQAAHLAVTDWRDLRVAADEMRGHTSRE